MAVTHSCLCLVGAAAPVSCCVSPSCCRRSPLDAAGARLCVWGGALHTPVVMCSPPVLGRLQPSCMTTELGSRPEVVQALRNPDGLSTCCTHRKRL
uniref:Putative secreted protein n=1 Tax=Ixodes ricinus TaxID=34613 RepID=A0A6B0U3Y4_IXORI